MQYPNPETAAVCDAVLFMISQNPESFSGFFRLSGHL